MNRYAVFIPSNISEGTSKSSNKHFANYLEYSLDSAFEWETQLNVTFNGNYITGEKFNELENKIKQIQKDDNKLQVWTKTVLALGSKIYIINKLISSFKFRLKKS